jgi:hypothetical protein
VKLDLLTSVWGEWHLSMYLSLSLPTLLAPGNLPKLAQSCELRYRILTTPQGKRLIERSRLFAQLRNHVATEVVLIGTSDSPRNEVHMEMMHSSTQAAAKRDAYLSVVPPDVIWPGECFSHLLRIIEQRAPRAISIPCVRVVSETVVEELRTHYVAAATPHMELTSREVQTLVLRHIHPEQLTMLDGNPFSRPTLWATFPVKGGGLLHVTFNREWFTVSPSRLAVTEIFCNDEHLSESDYYVCQNADEMLMASLTPMRQYMADMRRDWPFHPIDVAATLKMSQHGVPFAWSFVRSPLVIGESHRNVGGWRDARRRANLWASSALVLWRLLRMLDRLRSAGHGGLAGLVACAIFESDLHKHRRLRHPVVAVIPIDVVNTFVAWYESAEGGAKSPPRIAEFVRSAIKEYVGPAVDPSLAARLGEWRQGSPFDDVLLQSFGGTTRRVRAADGGLLIDERPVRDLVVSDGSVVVLH